MVTVRRRSPDKSQVPGFGAAEPHRALSQSLPAYGGHSGHARRPRLRVVQSPMPRPRSASHRAAAGRGRLCGGTCRSHHATDGRRSLGRRPSGSLNRRGRPVQPSASDRADRRRPTTPSWRIRSSAAVAVNLGLRTLCSVAAGGVGFSVRPFAGGSHLRRGLACRLAGAVPLPDEIGARGMGVFTSRGEGGGSSEGSRCTAACLQKPANGIGLHPARDRAGVQPSERTGHGR
jgi:hypothetical protein